MMCFILNIFIFLLAFFECKRSDPLMLTQYIENNRITEAKNASAVTDLPNAPKFESYSGFITVDKQYNSNLFFWFIPAFKNPNTSAVVIWLEGGPGVSSIYSSFVFNSLLVVDEYLNLTLSPYAWAQEFSMLYIDNPVGAGFSFTDDRNGFSLNQNSVANNLYEFLQQFYTIFSEYRTNELYITGESYAGKYIPAIGYKLMQMSNESNINFKGIAIGNGFIDPVNQINFAKLLKCVGLIDEKQFNRMSEIEDNLKKYIQCKNYTRAHKGLNELLNLFIISVGQSSLYDLSDVEKQWESKPWIRFLDYLNLNQTRTALHVGNLEYSTHDYDVYYSLRNDFFVSIETNFTELIEKYKVMIFVGNFDIIISVNSINGLLENRKWKYYKEFYSADRHIWRVSPNDTQIAGYAKSFGNFTQVIVRNAGHYVAFDDPRSALDLITRFINSKSFKN